MLSRRPLVVPALSLAGCFLSLSLSLGACIPIPGGKPAPRPGEGDAAVVPEDAGGRDGGDGGATSRDAGRVDGSGHAFRADGSVAQARGPSGGRVAGLAQSAAGEVVWAVGDEYGALFRSLSQGTSLERVALPGPVSRPVVGVPLESPSVVVLADGLGGGAWRSTDQGTTWAPVTSLQGVAVRRLVAEPSRPTWLYALSGLDPEVAVPRTDGGAPTVVGGLFLSEDQGATFRRVAFDGETVHDVAYVDGQHVVATSRGLLRAPTGGNTQSLSTETEVRAVVADPARVGGVLYVTAAGAVHRWSTGASALVDQLEERPLAGGLLTRGTEVLAVTVTSVWRGIPSSTPVDAGAEDGGGSTGLPVSDMARVTYLGGPAAATSVIPLRGVEQGLLLGTLGGGVLRLLGHPFRDLVAQPPAAGLRSAHRCPSVASRAGGLMVGCVETNPDGGTLARLYAGTGVEALGEVSGLGTPLPLASEMGPVALAYAVDGGAYAAAGRLMRLAPGGSTWVQVTPQQVFFVAAHPRVRGHLVLGVMREDGEPQVQVSTDDGATLTPVPGTFRVIPGQVTFHPTQDAVGYLVTAPEHPRSVTAASLRYERGLYRTDDAFQSLRPWGPTVGSGDAVAALAIPPSEPGTRLVVTERGAVHRTTDEGATWTPQGTLSGLRVLVLGTLPGHTSLLVAAGVPGVGQVTAPVQLSADQGRTWTPLPLTVPAVAVLAADPSGTGLLLGTVGQGLWHVEEGP
jgi:hypothetical protein